jgi:DNA-binding NtrC family response regulator
MPKLNGYALVARIRAKWPNMPIILTSGYLSPDAAKTMMNGSVEFIPKPLDAAALIAIIQRLMPSGLIPNRRLAYSRCENVPNRRRFESL